MNRRSFFNTMLGTAPVAAASLAMTPKTPRAVAIAQPHCPQCMRVLDITAAVRHLSDSERADALQRSLPTSCNCGWVGEARFAQEI